MNRDLLLAMFRAGLAAVDPAPAVTKWLLSAEGPQTDRFDRILVVGAGKAAGRMASAVEEALGGRLSGGIVIVKDGHGARLSRVLLREASHPVPDLRGIAATNEMLELLRTAGEKTLVLCLLSGGGSALLIAPATGITLEDKQKVTDLLLRAGADIGELNAVRKHLSAVKGGGLSRAACRAAMVTLILSDVLGDRLDVIASGPTVPDGSTYQDAVAVLGKYGLLDKVPDPVRTRLNGGAQGILPETMKDSDPCLRNKRAVVIGSLRQALDAAKREAEARGCPAEIVDSELRGEAREAVRLLAARAVSAQTALRPGEARCLVFGGETTVTVKGTGAGGRNQEFALAFALEIAGRKGITLLSAGTDGTDGPTDAAGAIVDGETVPQAENAGLSCLSFLDNNDSHRFFTLLDQRTGGQHHIKTGPTGTNVMDMQLIMVQPDDFPHPTKTARLRYS